MIAARTRALLPICTQTSPRCCVQTEAYKQPCNKPSTRRLHACMAGTHSHAASLLLVSAYGRLNDLPRLLLEPFIGQNIDRVDWLKVAITCYGVQSMCIAVSAKSSGLIVWLQHNKVP